VITKSREWLRDEYLKRQRDFDCEAESKRFRRTFLLPALAMMAKDRLAVNKGHPMRGIHAKAKHELQ
jgi:hypothetical protein